MPDQADSSSTSTESCPLIALKSNDTDKYNSFSDYKKKKVDDDVDQIIRPPSVPILTLFRYASKLDRFLLLVGSVAALVTGIGMPIQATVLGDFSNSFIEYNVLLTNETVRANDTLYDVYVNQFWVMTLFNCEKYAIIGAIVFVCSYIQMTCWVFVCERVVNQLRKRFFQAILKQDVAYFDEQQSGMLTTKLTDNLERIKEGIGDKMGMFIQSMSQFVGGYFIAFFYSWKLTLVTISLMPVVIVMSAFFGKFTENVSKDQQAWYAKVGAVAEEVFTNIKTVIAFNGQKFECERYDKALEKSRLKGVQRGLYIAATECLINVVLFSCFGLSFWYGAKLIISGEITKGTVFTVFLALMWSSFSVGFAIPQISLLTTAQASVAALYEVIDKTPDIDTSSDAGLHPVQVDTTIKFDNVSFKYPARPDIQVLKDISFEVKPGQVVALVGPSGCGKSTIVNLLLRFYDAESGKITLDQHKLSSLNIGWLRNVIGVVSQEPVLFDTTIEENLRLGQAAATKSDMVNACKMANAHDFIEKLPNGYKTIVGERGAQMSGGQKQRIAIARALLRNPKILLLDEATSALDTQSERVVQVALEKAQKGRTTIVVAHRLSTIRYADIIIAMESGQIKEMGDHDQLMDKEGLYHSLVMAQAMHTGNRDKPTIIEQEKTISPVVNHHTHSVISTQASIPESDTGSILDHESALSGSTKISLKRHFSTDAEMKRIKTEMQEEGALQASFLEIFRKSREVWWLLACCIFMAALQGVFNPLFSVLYNVMFLIYSLQDTDELLLYSSYAAIVFAIYGLLFGLTFLVTNYCFALLSENITKKLRSDVFRHILSQDASYFDDSRHATGKLATRLATDASNVKSALDWRFGTVIEAFFTVIISVAVSFILGWQLAIVATAFAPFLALGMFLEFKIRSETSFSDSRLFEEAGKTASEAIENIRTVKALGKEDTFYDKYCEQTGRLYQLELFSDPKHFVRQSLVHAFAIAYANSVQYFFSGAAYAIGAWMVQIRIFTPLKIFQAVFPIEFSMWNLGMAFNYFPEMFKARLSAGLIFRMLEQKSKIDNYNEGGIRPDLNGSVQLKSVNFAYPTRADVTVLRDLNIDVCQGKTIALVGHSGSGKSSVVGLIERFYDPLSGRVVSFLICANQKREQLSENDMKVLNIKHVRESMSLVSQEPILFDCTIEENIGYGRPEVTQAEIINAAKQANIHSFVMQLPDNYQTRVGERGTQLSGGQKQRIAIARALLRQPKLILLDEATSALDSESEKIVQEALDKAKAGRTCVIIAHRLSTIQNADLIIVVNDGEILEKGSHSELLELREHYYRMVQQQTSDPQ